MPMDPSRPATLKIKGYQVDYKLKAQVLGLDFLKAPVKHTIPIEMFQAIPLPMVPSRVYMEQMTSTSCCYNQKNLKCTAITDKIAYAPGENISLTLLTDASEFPKDISVNVYVLRTLIANDLPKYPKLPIYQQSATMPAIPAGKKVQNSIVLPLPMSIEPSHIAGSAHQWHYCVRVMLNITCGGNADLRVPIIIYALPALYPLPPPALPYDANPQIFDPIVLDPSKTVYPY